MEIGKVYHGHLRDLWAVHRPEQSYLVVGESTREEYIECLVSFGENRDWAELFSVLDPYFYEIKTD